MCVTLHGQIVHDMKKTYTIAMAVLALTSLKATAQTLHVEMGSVTYQMTAEQTGVMTYHEGRTVNILDKDYLLSDITQMYFDDAEEDPMPEMLGNSLTWENVKKKIIATTREYVLR